MNKKLRKIIATVILGMSLFGTSIDAYASGIIFSNSTVKDGLSQGTIRALFQDSNGYIWIGTTDGLNRYNGYEYKKFNKSSKDKKSIVNRFVSSINEDKDKNLWVGTGGGLSKINLNDYSVKNYTENNSNLVSNVINKVEIDKDGRVIICTEKGLCIYNEETDDFILEEFNVGSEFYSLNIINDGSMYGICDGAIFKYDAELDEYNELVSEDINKIKDNDYITDIYVDDNIIWIGTVSSGLYRYNIETEKIEDVKKYYKDEKNDISYKIKSIYKDKSGNILAGTDYGLVMFDGAGATKVYTQDLYDKYTIVNNNVLSIMQDSSGLVWVGTYLGLSVFKPDEEISYFCRNPNKAASILGDIIHGIHEDIDEKLWIGCSGYGVTIMDREGKNFEYLTTRTENKLNSDIISDIDGNDEKIFVATDNGINIIDRKTKKISYVTENLASPLCNSIYLEGDNLWVGTVNGIDIININDLSVTNLNEIFEKAGLNNYVAGDILKDSKGEMWIGSALYGGVVRYNPESKDCTLYSSEDGEKSISDNTIISIKEDLNGDIWIGTSSGLNKFNRDTETFKTYLMEDGLTNNTIYDMQFDDENNIWISTNVGIERISVDDNDEIYVQEFIKDNEFNNNSCEKTKKGEIVFGGAEGLFVINPQKVMDNEYVPELKFDTFKVNGLEVKDLKEVSIKENDTSVSIKLFITAYDNSKNTKYYYKTDKGSNEWIPIEGNEITFSDLHSGNKTITFKALSTNGAFSDIKVIAFKVKPPFWRGSIAIIMYTGCVLIFCLYIYKKIKELDYTISDKDKQLVREVEEKNELLFKVLKLERRKNNYLINMSHELRTPLNIIYSIQQLILELNEQEKITKNDIKKYMEMSGRNIHRLLKLINDLIDSSKIDSGSYKLFVEEKDIIYVIEEATLSLKSLVEGKGINLIFDTEIEECIMKFDVDGIERCIINLVNNACKFTSDGGQILVHVFDLDEKIKIEVSDTGCGIPEDSLNTIFDRFSQVVNSKREVTGGSGLGLTITKRLVELHQGEIIVTSEMDKGSKFTIFLPKNLEV